MTIETDLVTVLVTTLKIGIATDPDHNLDIIDPSRIPDHNPDRRRQVAQNGSRAQDPKRSLSL